jgi:uncharacterized protein YjiS (DUF1127 family)
MSEPNVAGRAPSIEEKTRTTASYPRHGMAPSLPVSVSAIIQGWVARSCQRQALGALDDHLLRDIGVSRQQALSETAKWFWHR